MSSPKNNSSASCPLFALPQEIKDIIWDHVLHFNDPVPLEKTSSIYCQHNSKHICKCPGGLEYTPSPHHYDRHPLHDNSGATRNPVYGPMWCIDPSTKEIIEIPIPHSVLAGRLVRKKMKEDIGVIFWKVNDFYFGTSYMAALAIDRLPYQFAKEIRKLRFDFTSKEADQTFRELAQMCPNLEALCINMDYVGADADDHFSEYIITYNHWKYVKSPENTLKSADGITTMRRLITNLKTLQLVGFDQIQVPDPETKEMVAIEVDVNHPDAVGPWLQAGMLAPKRSCGIPLL